MLPFFLLQRMKWKPQMAESNVQHNIANVKNESAALHIWAGKMKKLLRTSDSNYFQAASFRNEEINCYPKALFFFTVFFFFKSVLSLLSLYSHYLAQCYLHITWFLLNLLKLFQISMHSLYLSTRLHLFLHGIALCCFLLKKQ